MVLAMNEINSPVSSKINLTQLVAAVATVVTVTRPQLIPFVEIAQNPDVQLVVVAGIALVSQAVTAVFRTWFTAKRPKL